MIDLFTKAIAIGNNAIACESKLLNFVVTPPDLVALVNPQIVFCYMD
jgi:hypothetical protein